MNDRKARNAEVETTLQQVVSHWQTRMQVAGLSPNIITQLIEQTGSWENWCQTWSKEALSLEKRGVQAERQGLTVTAAEHYMQASLLYHFAQFVFFNDLEQKKIAAEHKYTVYQSAAPYLLPKSRHLEIPYKGSALKGYLRGDDLANMNVVIIIPGTDSSKEEYYSLEGHFLKRGLATFCVDGPGQGEGREFGPLDPDNYPSAIEAIIQTLHDVGVTGNIGLMGMELGGHLVLHASSVAQVKAIVSMNGFFNLASFWDDFTNVIKLKMHFALGQGTIEETNQQVRKFSLSDIPPPHCPVLAIHGACDQVFPLSNAQAIKPWSQGKADFKIFPEGTHVCSNIDYIYRPLAADWLADKLR